MPAPHALYGKMLAERTASRNVLVLFYLFTRVDEGVTMEAGASSSAFTHVDRRSAHEPLSDISEGS